MKNPTVYAIYSHINPAQVLRLIRTLRALSPSSHIVVHHDPGYTALDERSVLEAGGHLIPNPVAGEWGDFSQVEQHLRVMRWCLDHLNFDWFVTLTGQTYPLKPLADFEGMLAQSTYDAFVEHFDAYDPRAWPPGEAVRRYHYHYIKLPKFRYWHRIPPRVREMAPKLIRAINSAQPIIRLFTYPRSLRTRLGILTYRRPFGPGGPLLKGANQNTNYRRRALEAILAYVDTHPEYSAYFRRTALPDEAFFATALCSLPGLQVANDSLRLIHWAGPQVASGGVMAMEHLPALEASPAWFGLKFDQNHCPEILDALDRRLGIAAAN